MQTYRHTQIGWGLVVVVTLALLVAILVMVRSDVTSGLTVALIAVAIFALFGTMTVELDDTHLRLWFGMGTFQKKIGFNEIRAYHPVRNRWYHGWGVRWFPGGWLYNVSGLLAVELLLHTGTRIRVGTDEPEVLVARLQHVVGRRPPLTTAEIQAQRRRARRSAIVFVFVMLAIPLAAALPAFYVFTRPPKVTVSQQGFSVRSGGYSREIPLDRITSVSLEQTLPSVLRRTNGFSFRGTLRGRFRLAEMGDGQLFLELGAPPYVIVRTKTDYVIVNFKDSTRTRQLYADLAARVARF
ncbi:MAG: PH domain-containing protein [Vicinamibacterales bacterium]